MGAAYPSERILVFPTALLEELGAFQGYSLDVDRYVPRLLAPGVSRFVERAAAESDEASKQIIPYVVVRHQGRILSYTRGRRSHESKLVLKRSIGFGGHVEATDWTLFTEPDRLALQTAAREVREELGLPDVEEKLSLVGLVNDDSDAVGRVHFGFVYVLELDSPDIPKAERQVARLRFVSLAEAAASRPDLEGWSRIVVEMLLDPRLGAED